MARAGILDEMAMSAGAQAGAVDCLPVAGSNGFVYTVYGCSKGALGLSFIITRRSGLAAIFKCR
jgi:hypothetical protein